MDVIVDDHLLISILLGDEPPDLRTSGAQIFTTGLWYHRLCRAVSNPAVTGALSRRLLRAEPAVAASAARATTALPETIGLLSLRDLAWPMAQLLNDGVRLNLLSLEAMAAADRHGAELCLATTDENPQLLSAAASRGISTRLIDI